MKMLWYLLGAIGVAIVIGVRVAGIHMTEGEIFVEYWLHIVLGSTLMVFAYCKLEVWK